MVTIKVEIKEDENNTVLVKSTVPKTLKGVSENEKMALEVIYKNIEKTLKDLK